jgi:hypothetical protein
MKLPTIHGYPVIALAQHPDQEGTRRNLCTVLVDRGTDYPNDRYVVSRWCVGDRGWMAGTYVTHYRDAMAKFSALAMADHRQTPGAPPGAGVPLICCQSFAVSMLANRPPMHTVGCPNRRP